LDPQRNDLRASTLDYSDTSPFVSLGECAIHVIHGELGFALYLAQDAYQQSKEQYIANEPGFGPLSFASQTETNRARLGLSAGATRGAWSGGLALEGHFVHEKFDFLPSEEAQNLGAIPANVGLGYDLQGILVRAAYSRDARHTSDDVHTSRNWFTFGFDFKL